MIQALEKGAKVKTVGGVFGTVTGVKGRSVCRSELQKT